MLCTVATGEVGGSKVSCGRFRRGKGKRERMRVAEGNETPLLTCVALYTTFNAFQPCPYILIKKSG